MKIEDFVLCTKGDDDKKLPPPIPITSFTAEQALQLVASSKSMLELRTTSDFKDPFASVLIIINNQQ